MSIFKDKAIVLKIEKSLKVNENNFIKTNDKEFLYTLFTKTYGKIKASKKYSKTEKSLDLGYSINFEIITSEKGKIHKIKNIKIKNEFNINKDKDFYKLNKYLEILALVYKEIPEGIAFEEIYEIIETINEKQDIDEIKLILTKLKIKSLIGILNINHDDEIIRKILKFISNSKIENILKLTGINEEQKKELENL
ncbi:MAG: hypothetical protein PHI37_05755 [Candidatus Gracilibacteria bacterium]|nr:hypothetical protein [Candidatus Gracilibacteria bacterium]